MFDSLYVKCPSCGKELEFQSKSGPCSLLKFKRSDLTFGVAMDLNGDIVRCQFCNKRIKLELNVPKKVKIKLIITKGRKYDYEGNYNEKHPDSIKKQKELNKIFEGDSK